MKWFTWLAIAVWLVMLAALAHGHDSHTAKSPSEARVFDFYTSWYRPPERVYSCCSKEDCRVVEIKQDKGRWFFLDKVYQLGWREIPPDRLEHTASDPRESPDGNSHVCFNAMYVLCAVLGSGQ